MMKACFPRRKLRHVVTSATLEIARIRSFEDFALGVGQQLPRHGGVLANCCSPEPQRSIRGKVLLWWLRSTSPMNLRPRPRHVACLLKPTSKRFWRANWRRTRWKLHSHALQNRFAHGSTHLPSSLTGFPLCLRPFRVSGFTRITIKWRLLRAWSIPISSYA